MYPTIIWLWKYILYACKGAERGRGERCTVLGGGGVSGGDRCWKTKEKCHVFLLNLLTKKQVSTKRTSCSQTCGTTFSFGHTSLSSCLCFADTNVIRYIQLTEMKIRRNAQRDKKEAT